MKQIAIIFFCAFIFPGAMAQQINPYPKTIQVSGSAETEIVPDEIYVIVTLKEYEKKGTGKIGLEKIKSDFLGFCKSIGLADSLVTIAAYQGNNDIDWWRKKKKNKDELYRSIAYQVKFSTSKKMDELVEKLDDEATENFVIARVSHSKMSEYRRQLKIEAVRAAREKGIYLADAIGEKLGEAVTITEPGEYQMPYQVSQSILSNAMMDRTAYPDEANGVDFKKIKLRYEINATFALK